MTLEEFNALPGGTKAMWCFQQGMNPDPPPAKTNKRAERIQASIEDFQQAMKPKED